MHGRARIFPIEFYASVCAWAAGGTVQFTMLQLVVPDPPCSNTAGKTLRDVRKGKYVHKNFERIKLGYLRDIYH